MSNGVAAFNPIPELQTCQSFNVTWVLPEPGLTIPGDLQLVANPGSTGQEVGYVDVADSFLTNSFFWNPINVPPGEYQFNFLTYGVSGFPSQQFTVTNGPDTTCVVPFNDAVTSALPSATGSSSTVVVTVSATPSSGASEPIAVRINNGISGGAIAGIVIGCVVAVLALVVTLFTCKRRLSRRASGFADHPRPFLLRFGNYFIMIGQTAGLPSFSNDSSLRLSSRQNAEDGHISTITSGKTATAPAAISGNLSAMDVKKVMAESDKKLEDPEQGYVGFRADPFDDKNGIQKF